MRRLWCVLAGAVPLVAAPGLAGAFRFSSPAIVHGRPIPKKHTCDRADVSPPLRWRDPPAGTKSFAVIMEDPHVPVGSLAQWVVYDLPATSRGLPQGFPADAQLPDGTKNGLNDLGKLGYSGPCPPPGRAHHYYFRVYALDRLTGLGPRATAAEVFRAMRRRVLTVAELMATHQRRRPRAAAARSAAR
jgi:hypothetical protein